MTLDRDRAVFVIQVVPAQRHPSDVGAARELEDAIGMARAIAARLPRDEEVRVVACQADRELVLWESFDANETG